MLQVFALHFLVHLIFTVIYRCHYPNFTEVETDTEFLALNHAANREKSQARTQTQGIWLQSLYSPTIMLYCQLLPFLKIHWLNHFIENSNSQLRNNMYLLMAHLGLPWWLSSKESSCNAGATGDVGLIPWDWEDWGNQPQYSRLENPMEREAWWATVHRVAKSQIQRKWLSTHTMGYLNYALYIEAEAPRNLCYVAVSNKLPTLMTGVEWWMNDTHNKPQWT